MSLEETATHKGSNDNRQEYFSKRFYARPIQPMSSREETVQAMEVLMGTTPIGKEETPPSENTIPPSSPTTTPSSLSGSTRRYNNCPRPPFSNVFGDGPILLSDLPASTTTQEEDDGVVVGIDEAGRGSVCGPMIYGAAFWNAQTNKIIPQGLNDSKQLTDDVRSKLLDQILKTKEIGFCVRVLHASEISRNMLRPEPYNLNQMSHGAAMEIIRELLAAGVKISCCYIDTVGNSEHYQRKLEREFPGLKFVVESKADANYACCSAASVVAKVVRDRMAENWQFSERSLQANANFGSGYPSDPVCKAWMQDNLACRIFGFPDVVRFSWKPAKKALKQKADPVVFAADIEEEEDAEFAIGRKRQQEQMSAFLGLANKRKRLPYFERRGLQVVTKLA